MSTKIVSSKTNLEFTPVKNGRYISYGLLKNNKGDKFRIRITGTKKQQVQDFIDYQTKKAAQNQGIEITIGSNKKKKSLESHLEKTKKEASQKQVTQFTQNKWSGISVDIKPDLRIDNLSNKPLALHYEIDPPIMEGVTHDYTFQNTGTVTLECSVTQGKVQIQLFEFTDDLHKTSSQKTSTANNKDQIVSPTDPGKFVSAHDAGTHGNGAWNFRVTGVENAKYKISFDLVWDLTKDFNATQALKAGVALHS